ncbi:MAG TPA: TolC family protein [Methylomirabilota bacterium]|nr:TolC family protein [Methylomirabilota bacterium]
MRARGWLLVLLAGLGAGCATYRPHPIDPGTTLERFESRRLDDPGLHAFLAERSAGGARRWPLGVWDLDHLTLAAFYFLPDLDVMRARLQAAQAGIVTAGARPNPDVGVVLRYNIDAAAFSPWTIPFTFDVPIETGGKREVRVIRAERLADAARLGLAEAMWRARSRVRSALVAHLLAGRDRDLLRDEERVRQEAVDVLERRLAVGDVSWPDVDAARTDLATTRLSRRAAEGRTETTQVALASALGLPVGALDGVVLSWPDLDTPPPPEAVAPAAMQRAALRNRLDLQRALADYAAADAALKLEIAKQYPDVRLGPGYVFEEGDNKFQIGLSVRLPIFDRHEGPIAEATARRREAGAQFLARQAQVIREVDEGLRRYRSALGQLTEASRAHELLLAGEAATRRALEAGEEDRVTLVGVGVRRAVAARERLAALREAQTALGALEDAVERPVAPGVAR